MTLDEIAAQFARQPMTEEQIAAIKRERLLAGVLPALGAVAFRGDPLKAATQGLESFARQQKDADAFSEATRKHGLDEAMKLYEAKAKADDRALEAQQRRFYGELGAVDAPLAASAMSVPEVGGGPPDPSEFAMYRRAIEERTPDIVARRFQDPTNLAKAMQYGAKASDIKALADTFAPKTYSAGSYIQRTPGGPMDYLAKLPDGMAIANGVVSSPEGYLEALKAVKQTEAFAPVPANLLQKQGEANIDVGRQKVIDANRDALQFVTVTGPDNIPVTRTNPQQRALLTPQPQIDMEAMEKSVRLLRETGQLPANFSFNFPAQTGQGAQGGGLVGPDPAIQAGRIKDAEGLSGYYGKQIENAYTSAEMARTALPRIDYTLGLLSDGGLKTDKFTPYREEWYGMLGALGVGKERQQKSLENIVQLKQTIASILPTLPRSPGAQSNYEAEQLANSLAKITDPTQAVRLSLAYVAATKQQQIDYNNFIDSNLNEGKSPREALAEWRAGDKSRYIFTDKRLLPLMPLEVNSKTGVRARRLPDGRLWKEE